MTFNCFNYIDLTLLKPEATHNQIVKLCNYAIKHNCYSVCVNSCYVPLCKKCLINTDIKICCVIGFPLGATNTDTKIFEAETAIKEGANEIDMVINIGKLKDKKYEYILKEINLVKEAIGNNILKVIIETCLLNNEEKLTSCDILNKSNADFIKTSTGFSTGGANFDDVLLLLNNCSKKVKAAGGINSLETIEKYINMGVSRIGSSSIMNLID